MVFGIDSYGRLGSPKVVYSMVATTDQHFSKYWSKCEFGQNEPKMSIFVGKGIKEAIMNFYEDLGVFPVRLIIYREGISWG